MKTDKYRLKDVLEAVKVDTADYDAMCEIVAWCGGQATDEWLVKRDGERVQAVIFVHDAVLGTDYALPGDYIAKNEDGAFTVYRGSVFENKWEKI